MISDSFIKNLRNIMRNDHNVSGDAERIEQISWLLFLKVFDDREREFEQMESGYKSPITKDLKWRAWAAAPDGLTGEALIKFIDEKLFPTLKEIPIGDKTDPRHKVVRQVMSEAHNHMREGTLLRQVINEINQVDLTKSADMHAVNDIYEKLLNELQGAGDAGEFYTPRPITDFIVEMVAPKLGEVILDPACGTGGFLVNAFERLKSQAKTGPQLLKVQEGIRGWESKPLPHVLCVTNMLLHGLDAPVNIERRDSLSRQTTSYTDADRVDAVVANPPFGGSQKDGTEANFPKSFRTKETADLFIYLIITLLKQHGRAGIVLPDSFLSGDGIKARLKEELMTKCNLHTIVRMPGGEFTPYAAPKVSLLFFQKGEPTKETWFYEIPLPDDVGKNGFTKTKPLEHRHMDPVRRWWSNRAEGIHAFKVNIGDVKNWNLHLSNPHKPKEVINTDTKGIISQLAASRDAVSSALEEIRKLLA